MAVCYDKLFHFLHLLTVVFWRFVAEVSMLQKPFFGKGKFATCLFVYILARKIVLGKHFRNEFTKTFYRNFF